jgi:hypothetical protein
MKQASRPIDNCEARPIFQYNRGSAEEAMLPKSVIACLAAAAFVAATALMPTGAYATGGLQPGTWKWPPYADGGNMHRTACG